MKVPFHKTFLLLLVILSGCDFVVEEQVIDNYYLVAVDVTEDLSLSYKLESGDYLGVVGPTIMAVGNNDKYIIAQQSSHRKDKEIISYFIVPIYKAGTLWPEKGVIGPLTLKQFDEKRKELKIKAELSSQNH